MQLNDKRATTQSYYIFAFRDTFKYIFTQNHVQYNQEETNLNFFL